MKQGLFFVKVAEGQGNRRKTSRRSKSKTASKVWAVVWGGVNAVKLLAAPITGAISVHDWVSCFF